MARGGISHIALTVSDLEVARPEACSIVSSSSHENDATTGYRFVVTHRRSGLDSNWRFRLSSAKPANFFKFAISEGSHRPRWLVRVLRNSSKSCQGRGTGGSNSVRSTNESLRTDAPW